MSGYLPAGFLGMLQERDTFSQPQETKSKQPSKDATGELGACAEGLYDGDGDPLPCHVMGALIFMELWTSHFVSLSLRFLIHNVGLLIPPHGALIRSDGTWSRHPTLLPGNLVQVSCDIFYPVGVRVQLPDLGGRGVLKERGPRGREAPPSRLQDYPEIQMPSYLLNFLGEVLRNDAAFLLLLLVFAWKGEEGHLSAPMSLGHCLGLGSHFSLWLGAWSRGSSCLSLQSLIF